MAYVLVGLQALVAVVFTVSAVSKMRSADAYTAFVSAARGLVPAAPHRVAAGAVVAGEAAVPVLLVVPGTATLGFVLAGLLLAAFTVAILGALRRGETPSCRCFGTADARLGLGHVVRNTGLLAASAVGAVTASAAGGVPLSPGVGTAVAAGGLGAVLILVADDLVHLFRPTS